MGRWLGSGTGEATRCVSRWRNTRLSRTDNTLGCEVRHDAERNRQARTLLYCHGGYRVTLRFTPQTARPSFIKEGLDFARLYTSSRCSASQANNPVRFLAPGVVSLCPGKPPHILVRCFTLASQIVRQYTPAASSSFSRWVLQTKPKAWLYRCLHNHFRFNRFF